MQNQTNSNDPTDGIYFRYHRATGLNWLLGTANASTRTNTDSGTAVDTSWVKLRTVVNNAGTSIEYFIDDVSQGSVTTNIPATKDIGSSFRTKKTAGTLNRTFLVDNYKQAIIYGTPW